MKLKVDWRPSEWAIQGFLWVCLCIEHIICFLWRHTDDLQLFLPLLHWYSDMFTNRKKIPFAYLFHGHFRNNTTVCFDASNQEYFKNWVIYQRNTSKNNSITLQLFPLSWITSPLFPTLIYSEMETASKGIANMQSQLQQLCPQKISYRAFPKIYPFLEN